MPNLLLALVDSHLHRGEVHPARQVERRYRSHHARVGLYNSHVEAQILVGLARVALAGRDVVAAEALCGELTRRRPEDFFSHGWGACVSGELWAQQRLFGRARDALTEALRYATRPGERSCKLEMRALNSLADLELEEGDVLAARRLARRALALAKTPNYLNEFEEVFALQNLASVAAVPSYRRFSYEPSQPARSYRTYGRNKDPWQYPKGDPRRYQH
jgi:hypothetical protein